MIGEAVDAAAVIWRALMAWIVVGAVVVTALGYGLVALLWWAGRWARKGAARAYAAVSRTNTPPSDSRDADTTPEPSDARLSPSARHDHQQAA